jgi:uncharacterized protein (DUF2141 family)
VDLSLTGLRNAHGNILICLTAKPKAFPDCSKDKDAARAIVAADHAAQPVHLAVARPGTYAVSVIHDENANGKLDTAIMIPREGFGFSRNPRIAFGPPSFASAEFAVKGVSRQSIQMKYMF